MGTATNGRSFFGRFMKILAPCIVILMLCVMVFSFMFIVSETDHDCTGEDCPVCALIQQCEQTVRSVGGDVSAAAVSLLFSAFIVAAFLIPCNTILYFTPVSLKIRLNN